MSYTEIHLRNENKYYYRVLSVRLKDKVTKRRIYLGKNLSESDLKEKEKIADKKMREDKIKKNIKFIKSKILKLLKEKNIKKAGIFGSYARGEQRKTSDVDILIQPSEKTKGFAFIGLNLELEERLGKKVHLITYEYISPYIKENILNDEVRII